MEVRIRDYRGVERADLVLAAITLVSGHNGSGKSSIAQAIACALTGTTLPLKGITKGAAAALVHDGAQGGSVTVQDNDFSSTILWPKAELRSEGRPPKVTGYAAGIASILEEDGPTRAATLTRYLKSEATREDLQAVLADAGIKDETVDKVWQKIEASGWDGAHAFTKESGSTLKGRWEQVTREKYGSQKAVGWTPAGYDPDLAEETSESLQAVLADARSTLEGLIANSAVDDSRVSQLRVQATNLEDKADNADAAVKAVEAARAALTEAEEARRALPNPADKVETFDCPHCKGTVKFGSVDGHRALVPADAALSGTELKKARDAIASADGLVSRRKGELTQAETEHRRLAQDLELSQKAAEELKDLAGTDAPATAGSQVTDARTMVKNAEERLSAFTAKVQADELHHKIVTNQKILEALAPDGVRYRRLTRVLSTFNDGVLGELCAAAGWPPIVVQAEGLAIRYGGRPYSLLSTSEAFRCRVALQVAMAKLDQSELVVVDAADILDKTPTGRTGLMKLLGAAGIQAVVCMTMTKEEADKVAANGSVAVYWLMEANAERVNPQAMAAE